MRRGLYRRGYLVRNCIVILFACVFAFLGDIRAATSAETGGHKDLVWAASDGMRREIYFSTNQSGEWSRPIQITNDNADNVSPSIDTTPDGTKYIFWTALDVSGPQIRYATSSGSGWSDPKTIPSLPSASTGAFGAVDKAGKIWVVFTGNDDGDDDIYFTRLIGKEWTKISLVHADNDVPDINPILEVTADKTLRVFWESYKDGGKYIRRQAAWAGKEWVEEPVKDGVNDQAAESEVADIPDFVGDKSMVFTRSYE